MRVVVTVIFVDYFSKFANPDNVPLVQDGVSSEIHDFESFVQELDREINLEEVKLAVQGL